MIDDRKEAAAHTHKKTQRKKNQNKAKSKVNMYLVGARIEHFCHASFLQTSTYIYHSNKLMLKSAISVCRCFSCCYCCRWLFFTFFLQYSVVLSLCAAYPNTCVCGARFDVHLMCNMRDLFIKEKSYWKNMILNKIWIFISLFVSVYTDIPVQNYYRSDTRKLFNNKNNNNTNKL